MSVWIRSTKTKATNRSSSHPHQSSLLHRFSHIPTSGRRIASTRNERLGLDKSVLDICLRAWQSCLHCRDIGSWAVQVPRMIRSPMLFSSIYHKEMDSIEVSRTGEDISTVGVARAASVCRAVCSWRWRWNCSRRWRWT